MFIRKYQLKKIHLHQLSEILVKIVDEVKRTFKVKISCQLHLMIPVIVTFCYFLVDNDGVLHAIWEDIHKITYSDIGTCDRSWACLEGKEKQRSHTRFLFIYWMHRLNQCWDISLYQRLQTIPRFSYSWIMPEGSKESCNSFIISFRQRIRTVHLVKSLDVPSDYFIQRRISVLTVISTEAEEADCPSKIQRKWLNLSFLAERKIQVLHPLKLP